MIKKNCALFLKKNFTFIRQILFLAIVYIAFNQNAHAFEAFPQPKGMLFLNPYASFSWHNNPIGNGKYDKNDKIRQLWYGLFLEYGLTEKITVGFDTYLSNTWTSKNGKIGGKIDDKSFALEQLQIFGRYNFIKKKHFLLSGYTAVWTPIFGSGTGRLAKQFGHYNNWSNELRLEIGWKFDNGNAITFNIGYKAQYNSIPSRDILTLKITYLHKLPWDIIFYGYIKKNTYLDKGNNVYSFAQNNSFNLDAFNFINNDGYTAFDLMLAKKVGKGKFIVLAFSHSFYSVITCNKGMNYNFRAFWVEFWWFLQTGKK